MVQQGSSTLSLLGSAAPMPNTLTATATTGTAAAGAGRRASGHPIVNSHSISGFSTLVGSDGEATFVDSADDLIIKAFGLIVLACSNGETVQSLLASLTNCDPQRRDEFVRKVTSTVEPRKGECEFFVDELKSSGRCVVSTQIAPEEKMTSNWQHSLNVPWTKAEADVAPGDSVTLNRTTSISNATLASVSDGNGGWNKVRSRVSQHKQSNNSSSVQQQQSQLARAMQQQKRLNGSSRNARDDSYDEDASVLTNGPQLNEPTEERSIVTGANDNPLGLSIPIPTATQRNSASMEDLAVHEDPPAQLMSNALEAASPFLVRKSSARGGLRSGTQQTVILGGNSDSSQISSNPFIDPQRYRRIKRHLSCTEPIVDEIANYRRTVQADEERVGWRMHVLELIYSVTTVLLTLLNFGLATGRIAVGSQYFDASLTSAELALDVFTFVLQGLNFLTAVDDRGIRVLDASRIADRYLRSPFGALFDALTTFPVSLLLLAGGVEDTPFLRVNVIPRVLILHRSLDRIKELLRINIHPSAWRLLKYAIDVGVITTGVASLVSLYVRWYDGIEHAAHWFEVVKAEPTVIDLYVMIWFHCLKCLTDQKLPYPRSDGEFLVGVGVLFVAILVFLVIIASVEEIIVEFIEMSGRKVHKIDHAVDIMSYMGIPEGIQDEVVDYYEGMYKHFQSFDFRAEDDLFGDLPHDLRADLLYETNAKVIRSIPIFASVAYNKAFIDNFVTELQECVVAPGAPIINKGEEGDCMFFLHAGDADILDPSDDSTVLFTLTSGSYFGEIAMLFGWKRSNTIVARTSCSLYVITAAQFEAVMENFPDVLEIIVKTAVERAGMKVGALATRANVPAREDLVPNFEWNGMQLPAADEDWSSRSGTSNHDVHVGPSGRGNLLRSKSPSASGFGENPFET